MNNSDMCTGMEYNLRSAISTLVAILSECADDIGNTAVANQRNLTGSHPFDAEVCAIESMIGTTIVHQRGIDESVSLYYKCRSVIANIKRELLND